MPPLDGYEPFRELAELLSGEGFSDMAAQLNEAMRSGSTESEVLGELGIALNSVVSALGAQQTESMTSLISSCKGVIRKAWPDPQ